MKTIAILDQYRTGVQSSSGVQFETGPVPYINSQEEREKKHFLRPLVMLAVKKLIDLYKLCKEKKAIHSQIEHHFKKLTISI